MSELETIERFLRSQSTLSLATVDADGAVRVAPLFYLHESGPRLYWFSSASSAHSRNLARDAAAAVAVSHQTDEWRKIRGVQMRGTATRVRSRTVRAAVAGRYTERFRLGKLFAVGMARATLYRFDPTWLRYIDNARRFGYKFELTLPAPRLTAEAGSQSPR
jgi:uncharacterized protein